MLSILVCHSYFLRLDQKQIARAKPYPPLATLQVVSLLREAGHRVSFFDAMLADGIEEYHELLASESPQLVLFYEDNFNFLSKMCLATMRRAACDMIGSARRASARVIAAGPDVSDAPGPYLRAGADLALVGEGLSTLLELLPRLDAQPHIDSEDLVRGLSGVASLSGGKVVKASGDQRLGACPGCRPRCLGSGGHGSLSLGVDEGSWLLQSQHGRLARVLFPLHLVLQTHLGKSISAAQSAGSRRGNGAPQARIQSGSHLVRGRHLRISRRLGYANLPPRRARPTRRFHSPSKPAPT